MQEERYELCKNKGMKPSDVMCDARAFGGSINVTILMDDKPQNDSRIFLEGLTNSVVRYALLEDSFTHYTESIDNIWEHPRRKYSDGKVVRDAVKITRR